MLLTQFFSSEGMDQFPDAYLFKLPHLLYIIVSVIVFFVLLKFLNTKNPKTNKIVIIVSCILLLVLKYGGEAIFVYEWIHYAEPISSFSHPFWDYRTFFSFQVCGINNVLLPIAIAFNIKPMKDFVYPASIIGGLAVLLYPVGVLFGDPLVVTFPMIRTLVVHFLLIFLPIYLLKAGEHRLEPKNWLNTMIGIILVNMWSMFGNLFVDTTANNMYMMENPFYGGPIPFLNTLPNGIHTIPMFILVFFCFYLVFLLAGIYQKKHPIQS